MCEKCNNKKATLKLRRVTNVSVHRWRHLCGYCARRIKDINEGSYSSIIEEVKL